MKLSVASGKGGTGKTTVATNLAYVAAALGRHVAYLDCDVEEPNGDLFLKPHFTEKKAVKIGVPAVDESLCTGCGQCGKICQYSAILAMNRTVLTFPELCHSCGGCWEVCPSGAIKESFRQTGWLHIGTAGKIDFVKGLLNVGEVMSPPVIRCVKAAAPNAELIILDCPPGTSCPVIEAIRDSDFVLLVTEPTPFGLNDLRLAVETVRKLKLPFGVIINRADCGDNCTKKYCDDESIAILAEIPDVREVAEAYSRGIMAAEVSQHYRKCFEKLLTALIKDEQR